VAVIYKQVATVMVTTGCIAAAHGSFSCIRQVAPMCTCNYMVP